MVSANLQHIFTAGNCTYCGADDHDVDLPEFCDARTDDEPGYVYSTSTGDPTVFDPSNPDPTGMDC